MRKIPFPLTFGTIIVLVPVGIKIEALNRLILEHVEGKGHDGTGVRTNI